MKLSPRPSTRAPWFLAMCVVVGATAGLLVSIQPGVAAVAVLLLLIATRARHRSVTRYLRPVRSWYPWLEPLVGASVLGVATFAAHFLGLPALSKETPQALLATLFIVTLPATLLPGVLALASAGGLTSVVISFIAPIRGFFWLVGGALVAIVAVAFIPDLNAYMYGLIALTVIIIVRSVMLMTWISKAYAPFEWSNLLLYAGIDYLWDAVRFPHRERRLSFGEHRRLPCHFNRFAIMSAEMFGFAEKAIQSGSLESTSRVSAWRNLNNYYREARPHLLECCRDYQDQQIVDGIQTLSGLIGDDAMKVAVMLFDVALCAHVVAEDEAFSDQLRTISMLEYEKARLRLPDRLPELDGELWEVRDRALQAAEAALGGQA